VRDHVVTCRLAAAADLRADAAVLVVSRVTVALLGAGDACDCAGLDRRADEPDVRTTLARRDPRGRVADVGAVEGDTDHADQRAHVVLSQARVGAGGAARSAIDAFLGASEKPLANIACRQRVQLDDLAKGHLRKCARETRCGGMAWGRKDRRRSPLQAGGGTILLDTIAAAVIGGVTPTAAAVRSEAHSSARH
jgi:hypothetical protein